MKKITYPLLVTAFVFCSCGDPSAERDYTKTSTSGGTETTPNSNAVDEQQNQNQSSTTGYDSQDDPAKNAIDTANRGEINKAPSGVNTPK